MTMKVLYFSNVYESHSFIARQVEEVSGGAAVYYACCAVDDPAAPVPPYLKLIRLVNAQTSWIRRMKNKLELSDVYFNLYHASLAKSIASAVEAVDPDIIHCQYGYDALLLLDNDYRTDRKYVITFRGFDASLLLILDKYRQKLQHYLSLPNVHPVFVCHALMNNLLERSIVLNPVRAVVYSNTDTEFYKRTNYNVPRDTIVFTQVSNFREKKGHRYTIRAFEKFHERHPRVSFELIFAGELDHFAQDIQRAFADSPIVDRIKFIGKRDRAGLKALLEQSHVFVHNSITSHHNDQEGIPNAIMEAMAMELPAVATYHAGIPELLHQGEDLFLAHEKDIDEYVSCIEKAMHAGYSKRNRARIVEAFSSDVFRRHIFELYHQVLHGAPEEYRQCTQCVLDTRDDPAMIFDDNGVCNYCYQYRYNEIKYLNTGERGRVAFDKIVERIKAGGKGKPYDCILGLSGGVDSTYLAYVSKQAGLRPLAVHFDNGWNSELAVNNIEQIVNRLDIPLHTFVVDWPEFKDLQLSFLKASVVDIEIVTDHAIIAKLYDLALQHDIGYILSGTNIVTESILPANWIYNKKDHVHIRGVHQQFGTRPLKTYPLFNSRLKWKVSWKGIQSVSLLDYVPYNKKEVKRVITESLGWRDYGGKHYESIFTRFYQGYILPQKFGVDKRKAHLSNLICSGQITRAEALAELQTKPYSDDMFGADYQFVLKKLGLSDEEFRAIMQQPVKRHADYPVETTLYERFPALRFVGFLWRTFKKVRTKL